MKTYHLTFFSKNKKSLDKAFFFYLHHNIITKSFLKKRKKQFFTILKSPHINKTAQEQFDILTFSRQLTIYPTKSLKFLFFLKKMNLNLFSSVKLKIKLVIHNKKGRELHTKLFNPIKYKLNILLNKNISNNYNLIKETKFNNINDTTKKIKSFLKILDIYGELNISSSLDSSVGRAKD